MAQLERGKSEDYQKSRKKNIYKERLREMRGFRLKEKTKRNTITKKNETDYMSLQVVNRERNNRLKMQKRRFRFCIGKKRGPSNGIMEQ